MLLVTSVNNELFAEYGERMIREFDQNSDGSVRLAVIFEGHVPVISSLVNVDILPLRHPDHAKFLRRFGHLHEARGLRISIRSDQKIDLTVAWRFDAVRFSFKIFSLLQVLQESQVSGAFGWIDADVRCLKPFSAELLREFFPNDREIASYLGRTKFPLTRPCSECGFLGFNAANHESISYLNRVRQVYLTGEFFEYEEWHDSWIWDRVRIEFEGGGKQFKNLSGAYADTEHPFVNSGLGFFFDHLKGQRRKKNGTSFVSDRVSQESN